MKGGELFDQIVQRGAYNEEGIFIFINLKKKKPSK